MPCLHDDLPALSDLSEWAWREFFEIKRDGFSGQLDRESMDCILRDNGILGYEERLFWRQVWQEAAHVLRSGLKPSVLRPPESV